jgi:membrane protease YdiL (CAAX protease family)
MAEMPTSPRQVQQKQIWIELGVVVLACVAYPLFVSYEDTHYLPQFQRLAISSLLRSAASSAVVMFVIWKSKEPLSRFGIKRFDFLRDIVGGVGLFVLMWVLRCGADYMLRTAMGPQEFNEYVKHRAVTEIPPPTVAAEAIFLGAVALLGSLWQEMVMRAYLITRLEELVDSTVLAVLLATAAFVSYHTYEGNHDLLIVAIHGLLFAVFFCKFRRVAPLVLAHAIWNYLAYCRLLWNP